MSGGRRSSTATSWPSARWIKRRRPTGQASLRLLCCPPAGAGASAFLGWPRSFAPDIELCAVEAPGRESRLAEEPISRMGPLIEELSDAVEDLCDRPLALFGHSLGALVAFELARELRRRDVATPVHLFVAACPPPHRTATQEPLHGLDDDALVGRVAQLNGIPPEVLHNDELLRLVVPALRADVEVFETYTNAPEPPLTCPLSALGGADDRHIGAALLAGWCRHTLGDFRLRLFPGDHFFLQHGRDPVVSHVLQELRR